jgi:hypothetical protein
MQTLTAPGLPRIPRRAAISSWRAWNSLLDTVFYDVGALSAQERARLSAYAIPEGSILIVHPRKRNVRIRMLMPREFVREQESETGEAVDAVIVAGVGSSAIGTAALARNVADYLNRPAAGVVSGYGMSDVITEGLGGWFVLGATNTLRDALARLFDAWDLKDHVRDQESHQEMTAHFATAGIDRERFIYGSPDSTTLLYLLSRLGGKVSLLLGHSKGNYSIENALEGWLSARGRAETSAPSHLTVVTLGAVVWFRSVLSNVHQFIGGIDLFGMMNSRPGVARVWVPGAGHSLNPALPDHLSVVQALQLAGVH